MTQPLALLLYEKLLPGTQLVNRLQDLGWRVQTLHDAAELGRTAEEQKPVIVVADLSATRTPVDEAIRSLRQNPATSHLPIVAFGSDELLHRKAAEAGATLVASDTAILQHLNQFIDQALTNF
jgi:CheY-like chemotaxis protein